MSVDHVRGDGLVPDDDRQPRVPANRRVDFDTTVNAMARTAREMYTKYKETSEGGLAVSLALR